MSKTNIVISYSNPDTDGVACSIAMAKLLSMQDEQQWVPMILGSIGEETQFVLQQLNLRGPTILPSFANVDKITLVDTHHKAQLPQDFPFERVVTIIDHHPNGDDQLFSTATITNQKIGAAASIVAKLFIDQGVMDISMLQLLGFAILSNTLNFSAPSTTNFDRDIYAQINRIAPISEKLIDEMFEQRSVILKRDMYIVLNSDFKIFDTKAGRVGISQIEAYNLVALINIEQTLSALTQIANEKHLNLCLFNGVDIKTGQSLVFPANKESADLLCDIFQLGSCTVPLIFNRILLRKTDFVPPLNM